LVIAFQRAPNKSEINQNYTPKDSLEKTSTLTENFGNVGIVHVGARFENLAPLIFGPHHEGVHWSLHVGLAIVVLLHLANDFCAQQFAYE